MLTKEEARMAEFDPKVLREAMSLAGLSAQALAERAGLHRVTVANYARGLACPPDTWARLEKALREALDEHARAVEKARKKLR